MVDIPRQRKPLVDRDFASNIYEATDQYDKLYPAKSNGDQGLKNVIGDLYKLIPNFTVEDPDGSTQYVIKKGLDKKGSKNITITTKKKILSQALIIRTAFLVSSMLASIYLGTKFFITGSVLAGTGTAFFFASANLIYMKQKLLECKKTQTMQSQITSCILDVLETNKSKENSKP